MGCPLCLTCQTAPPLMLWPRALIQACGSSAFLLMLFHEGQSQSFTFYPALTSPPERLAPGCSFSCFCCRGNHVSNNDGQQDHVTPSSGIGLSQGTVFTQVLT